MKTFLLILAALVMALKMQAQTPWREATVAEMQAGTAGTPVAVTPRRLTGGGGGISSTNFLNYSLSNSWPSYASLTVTGCTAFPFLNGTNCWLPWSGSRSIFTKGNTNFLFYEARGVGTAVLPTFVFSRTPALTNLTAAAVYEYNDAGAPDLQVNAANQFQWTADDEATYDTTAILANTLVSKTNVVILPNGELNIQAVGGNVGVIFSGSNVQNSASIFSITAGIAHSGLTGGINFFGNPFGEYVTNNQVGASGFEAGKINYTAAYNQKADTRMGLDLGVYFNTDASGGSMIETMVEQPTYYGTPNNPAGGWSRNFIRHWKGIWAGDLNVAEHTYNILPPARLTVAASTNDIPILVLTNQGTKFTSPTNVAPAGFWTDNTNVFIAQRGQWFAIPQINTTNATLSAQTSFTWKFTYPFSDTNYSVTCTGAGVTVGTNLVIGAKTTTNVVITFPSFTGILNAIAARQ